MKKILAIVLALTALSCTSNNGNNVKSLRVYYPLLDDFFESYSFKYNSSGQVTEVEQYSFYDSDKRLTAWKYNYNSSKLSAVAAYYAWDMKHSGMASFTGDLSHITSMKIAADKEENPQTGILFLGQSWECTYDGGHLVKSTFYDYTSDGMDTDILIWNSDGDLVGYQGSDPSVSVEYKDIEYTDTPNPFKGLDPLAYLLDISEFYWHGLTGERPSRLIKGFTRLACDNDWETRKTDYVTFEYQSDSQGRLTQISRLFNGIEDKVIAIEY